MFLGYPSCLVGSFDSICRRRKTLQHRACPGSILGNRWILHSSSTIADILSPCSLVSCKQRVHGTRYAFLASQMIHSRFNSSTKGTFTDNTHQRASEWFRPFDTRLATKYLNSLSLISFFADNEQHPFCTLNYDVANGQTE